MKEGLQKVLGRRWMVLLYIVVGLAMTGVITGLTVADLGLLHAANFTSLEGLFRFRLDHDLPVKKASIVLVGFNDDTDRALGLPLGSVPSRYFQTKILRALVADGAKVIGFDVTFKISTPY